MGSRDGLKIFYILEKDLRLDYHKTGKTCTCVKYSESGHLLGVGLESLLHILDSYSYEVVAVIT